jgi:hypothetical protein
MLAATASARAGSLLACSTTAAPSAASRRAVAAPMPRDDPVMNAVLPESRTADPFRRRPDAAEHTTPTTLTSKSE